MPAEQAAMTGAERELAKLLVNVLQLEGRDPAAIDPQAPLFGAPGNGWGLDSIDALEIALALQQNYGVILRSEDEATRRAFGSLRALADHVRQHGGATAAPSG
ncbi:MAG: phosphopantetheine-binding protein [Nevskia sp.]|nr:phosphopantetheine-binding protein [Nevskia sp.]